MSQEPGSNADINVTSAQWRQWSKQFWKLHTRWTRRTREPWDIYASLRLPFHVFLSSKRHCFFFCFFFFFFFSKRFIFRFFIAICIIYIIIATCVIITEFRTFYSGKEKAKSNVNITSVNIKYTYFFVFLFLEKRKHEKRNLKLSSYPLYILLPQEIILLTSIIFDR